MLFISNLTGFKQHFGSFNSKIHLFICDIYNIVIFFWTIITLQLEENTVDLGYFHVILCRLILDLIQFFLKLFLYDLKNSLDLYHFQNCKSFKNK